MVESNGKTGEADRRRHFEIAPGSALAWAAIQDVRVIGKALALKKKKVGSAKANRTA
jgi:hypothetical protein